MNALKENNKILFIGLPCHVAALKKYMEVRKQNIQNLYTIKGRLSEPPFSSIKQTNHLIMGKNSTSFYSISLVTNPFFTGFYTFTAFLPVLSHVWPTLHVLSSNYIPSWPDNC